MYDYQIVINKTNCDGIGNILKGYVSALSINDNSVIECNPQYMYGNYDSILEDKHIYKDQGQKIERAKTCRLLILKEEEPFQQHTHTGCQDYSGIDNPFLNNFFCPTLIDWNFNPEKIHPIVRNRILKNFDKIKFKPIITEFVDKYCENFSDKKVLGISIRTWKGAHENLSQTPYNFEAYITKIKDILLIHNNVNKIILSIDNHNYFNEYEKFFNELNIPYELLNKSPDINPLQYAIIKAFILSKCNIVIGSQYSTYTELIMWLSRFNSIIYPV
jgi:hypothetical protein